MQYSPQDLDPDCWAASRVSAALRLPSLVRGELVPHPAKRYKNGVRPKRLRACVAATGGHFERPL